MYDQFDISSARKAPSYGQVVDALEEALITYFGVKDGKLQGNLYGCFFNLGLDRILRTASNYIDTTDPRALAEQLAEEDLLIINGLIRFCYDYE
jgi:hypothetical protein